MGMSFGVILIQAMFGQPWVLTRMLAMSHPDVDSLCLSAKVSRVVGGKVSILAPLLTSY